MTHQAHKTSSYLELDLLQKLFFYWPLLSLGSTLLSSLTQQALLARQKRLEPFLLDGPGPSYHCLRFPLRRAGLT